ncbi:MAG: di-trans,poly-cis-decaprenylcistransferase [Chlamydiia bacterium]|nr:di-trans,poly-cis-decaprenylcistransferase [Chlamydiia bacterium]
MSLQTEQIAEADSTYSSAEISLLDPHKIPKHIAIIMDGNRRWARQKNLPAMMGHWEGAEALIDIVRSASDLGVKAVTVYAFSTENWARPEEEIEALMDIFELYLNRKKENMILNGICLNSIGDISRLPKRVQEALHQTKEATKHCDKIQLVIAFNYGGRDEIRRAMTKILDIHRQTPLENSDITEELIARHLDTFRWGDPDLLIRTSGELRLSNFLLWQLCYTEIFVTDVLWPDFSRKELLQAVLAYQTRDRRRGGSSL